MSAGVADAEIFARVGLGPGRRMDPMKSHDRLSGASATSRRASAFQPPRPATKRAEGQRADSSAHGHSRGANYDFGTMAVRSSSSTRASKSGCSCGATCPKCRNPNGVGGERTTANGGGGGGAAAAGGAAPVAAPARRAELLSGPRYTPRGAIAPTTSGGLKSAGPFVFDAVFKHDPANGIYARCGEIHQDIKWNKAAAASFTALFGSAVPHSGFPSTHPANVWIEDRDSANTRYGRRSGPMSAPGPGDQYTNSTGAQDQANGAIYHGSDNPSNWPAALAGRWTFMVLAFDMCNHGVQVGNADFITIDW